TYVIAPFKKQFNWNSVSNEQSVIQKEYFDTYGNSISIQQCLSEMGWNIPECLRHFQRGTTNIWCCYDNFGERTRKIVEKNGILEIRFYFNGFELYRKYVNHELN